MDNSSTVYQAITDHIIGAIERGGIAPWRRPWVASPANIPRNALTGNPYSGINVFVLSADGHEDPRWVTFRQAQQMGGRVRVGEHGLPVMFWKRIAAKSAQGGVDADQDLGTIPCPRRFTVFHVSQVDGLCLEPLEPVRPLPWEGQENAEAIVRGYAGRPCISHGGVAAYSPRRDLVLMPRTEDFESAAAYYGTLFHELAHSTGHPDRLARPGVRSFDRFGSNRYAKEELVAEMAAAFLSGAAGIENLDQSAAYINGWMDVLRRNNRLLVQAAGTAGRATDYVLGLAHVRRLPAAGKPDRPTASMP